MKKTYGPDAASMTSGGSGASDVSYWAFGPAGADVTVRNAELLLAHLPVFLTGWPCRRIGGSEMRKADIEIAERPDGRITISHHGPGGNAMTFDDAFAAADGLSGALIARFVARCPQTICFHAGSVRIGDGLVVLLGDSFAGKSSVALQIASAGYRLFGDDRLAVGLAAGSYPVGMCLGLTPKVRLPLPADCGDRFAEYVDAFTEIRDEEAAYLKLWDAEAAGFAEESPIAAFVILDRGETGPCSLSPVARSEIVRSMLVNCFSPQIETQSLVPAMTRLASQVSGYRLSFSSSREAAISLTAAMRDRAG